MSKTEETQNPGSDVEPVYQTESIEDLQALLGKAEVWATDELSREGIGAEFRDAREFVEEELLNDGGADPRLVTDGGQSGTGVSYCPECGQNGVFDGQGRFANASIEVRFDDDGWSEVEVRRSWYQMHCAECDATFRILENKEETGATAEERGVA